MIFPVNSFKNAYIFVLGTKLNLFIRVTWFYTGRGEAADGVLVNEENLTEPTMGEKLASLNLIQNDKPNSDDSKIDDPKGREDQPEPSSSLLVQPPSADSVQVLLRQALRADDRVLLLDCLYNRDEKVAFWFALEGYVIGRGSKS